MSSSVSNNKPFSAQLGLIRSDDRRGVFAPQEDLQQPELPFAPLIEPPLNQFLVFANPIDQLQYILQLPTQSDAEKLQYNNALEKLFLALAKKGVNFQEYPDIGELLKQLITREVSLKTSFSSCIKLFNLGATKNVFSLEARLEIRPCLLDWHTQYKPLPTEMTFSLLIRSQGLTEKEAEMLFEALTKEPEISSEIALELLQILGPLLKNSPHCAILGRCIVDYLKLMLQQIPEEPDPDFFQSLYLGLDVLQANSNIENSEQLILIFNTLTTVSHALLGLQNRQEQQSVIELGLNVVRFHLGSVIKKADEEVSSHAKEASLAWLKLLSPDQNVIQDEKFAAKILETISKLSKLYLEDQAIDPLVIHFLQLFLEHPRYQSHEQLCDTCFSFSGHLSLFSHSQMQALVLFTNQLIERANCSENISKVQPKGKKPAPLKGAKQHLPLKQFKPHKLLSSLLTAIGQEHAQRAEIFYQQSSEEELKIDEEEITTFISLNLCIKDQQAQLLEPLITHLFQPTENEYKPQANLFLCSSEHSLQLKDLHDALTSLLKEKNEKLYPENALICLRACVLHFPTLIRKHFPSFPLPAKGIKILNEEQLFFIALPLMQKAMHSKKPESREWVEKYLSCMQPDWWHQKQEIAGNSLMEEKLATLFACLDPTLNKKHLNDILLHLCRLYHNQPTNWVRPCFDHLQNLVNSKDIEHISILKLLKLNFDGLENMSLEEQEALQGHSFAVAQYMKGFSAAPYEALDYQFMFSLRYQILQQLHKPQYLQALQDSYMKWVPYFSKSQKDDVKEMAHFPCLILMKLGQHQLLNPKKDGGVLAKFLNFLVKQISTDQKSEKKKQFCQKIYNQFTELLSLFKSPEWIEGIELSKRVSMVTHLLYLHDVIPAEKLIEDTFVLFSYQSPEELLMTKCSLADGAEDLLNLLNEQGPVNPNMRSFLCRFVYLLLESEADKSNEEQYRTEVQTLSTSFLRILLKNSNTDCNYVDTYLLKIFFTDLLLKNPALFPPVQSSHVPITITSLVLFFINTYETAPESLNFLQTYITSNSWLYHYFLQLLFKVELPEKQSIFFLLQSTFPAASTKDTLLKVDPDNQNPGLKEARNACYLRILTSLQEYYIMLEENPNMPEVVCARFSEIVQGVLPLFFKNCVLLYEEEKQWPFLSENSTSIIQILSYLQRHQQCPQALQQEVKLFFDRFLEIPRIEPRPTEPFVREFVRGQVRRFYESLELKTEEKAD